MSKYCSYKVDPLVTSSRFVATIIKRYFYRPIGLDMYDVSVLSLNRDGYDFSLYLKGKFKNLHQQSKKKSRLYINFSNDETQTQKPNRFDHKRYKGRQILNFEFVFTVNNGECNARWSMSFCLSTCIDNLLAMNQTKYLIRPTIMIITITKIKNKTRK